MRARRRLLALAAPLALALGACGSDTGGQPLPEQVDFSTSGWETDFSRHSVPLSEFTSGGPPRDGIPPIDDPEFVGQEEADEWLSDREPVIVVEVGDAVRAYPIQILVWHEIVNDTLGGRPITVSYCPLCNSAVVFDRRVDGRTLTFGTTGNLRNSDLVMWDRQTESWWQQITAEAVVGELTGERLEVLLAQTLSFADFRDRFPGAEVLSRDTGASRPYGQNPYTGYDSDPGEQPFLLDSAPDDRLPPKERVAAVFTDAETAVYPFSRLVEEPVVNDEVGGRPVVVFYKPGVVSPLDAAAISESRDVGTAAAFDRRLDGRTLDFTARGGAFLDRQTASRWDITGRAVAGPLRGERLRQLRHDEQFWFALAAFVPEARIAS